MCVGGGDGIMENLDISISTISFPPSEEVEDAWSDSEGHVSLDSQQDYELIEAKHNPDGFYLLFKRPFSTCDPRDYLIEGGFGIMEEMCVNYIHYYPQTKLELCKSHVDPGYLHKYFNFINRFHGNDQCVCGEVGVTEQYSQLQWDTFTREVLDSLYNTAPISMHCNQSTAHLFPGEWDKQPVPMVPSILEKPRYPCEGGALPTSRPLTPIPACFSPTRGDLTW